MTNLSNPHEGMDEMGDHLDLRKKCKRQHALILQMRDELRATLSLIRRNAPELSGKQLGLADDVLAAANQYLGEKS